MIYKHALDIAAGLFIFTAGLCIGSFLNVIICRVPKKESFVQGRSHCPACGRILSAGELIPVVSYLIQKRRCRGCGVRIPARYIFVELLSGAGALACAFILNDAFLAAAVYALFCGLAAVSFIDADTLEIPDGLIIYLLAPAAAMMFLFTDVPLTAHLIGAVSVSLPMLVLALIIPGCFGGGDIKLMAVCGLALGWKLTVLAFFFALIPGGIYGVFQLWIKKENKKKRFAFGPCLSAGVFFSALLGNAVLEWYLGFFKYI